MKNADWSDLIYFISILIFFTMMIAFMCKESKNQNADKKIETKPHVSVSLYEISIRGEKHEYMVVLRGVCHVPNCKYCTKMKSEHAGD